MVRSSLFERKHHRMLGHGTGGNLKVGSLVKRRMLFDDWVSHSNDWMKIPKYQETGIVVHFSLSLLDYEVLWQGEYMQTHSEDELEEIK